MLICRLKQQNQWNANQFEEEGGTNAQMEECTLILKLQLAKMTVGFCSLYGITQFIVYLSKIKSRAAH